ncbi:Glycerol transport system permease protein OS=Castellaniella defragrans OX=75697 GN=HNR28_000447 PE=3 SV=1 [Castellaniella defragrans]
MRPFIPRQPARMLLILILLGVAAFPIYWMLVTSLTPSKHLFDASPQMFPDFRQVGVYREIFLAHPVSVWLRNSAIVALGTMALSIALAIFPAYALSRFKTASMAVLGLALFVTQMLPEAMLVVPLYTLYTDLALINTLAGLVLANTAFTVPVVTWILKGAIDAIPEEIEEAARMDGCSRFGTVLSVITPIIAPTLAATAVIAFFNGWNEYIFAQTLIVDSNLHTASVGLARFIGELSTPMHSVMSVALIYTLPAVVFYLFAQRYVVAGMTAGSVKG